MLGCITDSMGMSLSKLRDLVMDREDRCAAVHGVTRFATDILKIQEFLFLMYL